MIERSGSNLERSWLWWVDVAAAKLWPFAGYSRAPGWMLVIEGLPRWPRFWVWFYYGVQFGNPWNESDWEPTDDQHRRVKVEAEIHRTPDGVRVVRVAPPLELEEMAVLDAMLARMIELGGGPDD